MASFRSYTAYIILQMSPILKGYRHCYRFVNSLMIYNSGVLLETSPPKGGLVGAAVAALRYMGRSSLFDFVGLAVHLDNVVVLVLPAHSDGAHPGMLIAAVFF